MENKSNFISRNNSQRFKYLLWIIKDSLVKKIFGKSDEKTKNETFIELTNEKGELYQGELINETNEKYYIKAYNNYIAVDKSRIIEEKKF